MQACTHPFHAIDQTLKIPPPASYTYQAIAATDPAGARAFLESLGAKRERLGPEAALFVDMETALLKIKQVKSHVFENSCGWLDRSC